VSQQQKSPYEEFILFGIVLGLVAAIAWGIWFFFHAQLTEALRLIRLAEMAAVSLLVDHDYAVDIPGYGMQSMHTWRDWLPRAQVAQIGWPEIVVSTYVSVLPLKNFFVGGLFLMAFWAIWWGPSTRYRRRMTLQMLIEEQAKSFPTIAPFVAFDPANQPARSPGDPVPEKLPLFAEAPFPEEWLAYHDVPVEGGRIKDLNKAWYALAEQLGQRWQGPLKLQPHAQALYAAFALRFARKRKESEELLNELAVLWTSKDGIKIPLKLRAKVRKIIKDPKVGGKLKPFADAHAFETTALCRCLQRAREEGGVLAPASFVWLRAVDRNLWYPLNNLGRKSYHAEAAGALTHFTHERIAGQKIPSPRFEDVIKSFEDYLKSPDARPVPPRAKPKKKTA